MIARYWHGVVQADNEHVFETFLKEKAIPKFDGNPGFMDFTIIKKYDFNAVHFNVITYWQNYEYIKQFAGDNINKAIYYTEDQDLLLELEEEVKHYEVMDHIMVTP